MTTIPSNGIYSQYADFVRNNTTAAAPASNYQSASVFSQNQPVSSNPMMDQCRQMNNITNQLIRDCQSAPVSLAPNQIQATTQTNPFNQTAAVSNTGSGITANSSNMPMTSTSTDTRSKKYEGILKDIQVDKNRPDIANFKKIFEQNKGKYEAVAKRLGVPDQLVPMVAKAIWGIHCRESSGDFGTYLHNGEKLGKPTTLVPAGINFSNWEDAAVDAMKRELPKMGGKIPQSVPEWCAFAELYNGTGYENKGVPSPYVLAGTNKYTAGKYVADGQYSATAKDQQPGFAALMLA
jgi:lysozyme family protein